jgi:hypothetical protein
MMNEYLPLVFPLMIGLIIIASLGEMAVSSLWLPAYYQYAIPLFRKEYPLMTVPDLAAQIPELEQKLKRSAWRPSIVFRALNANEIAFRNKFGNRNAMSGLIRLEPNQGRMRISGHLYWTFFLMPILFLVMMFVFPFSGFFLLFMLAVFVMTFGMQRYQYGKIAAVIAETAVSTSLVQSVSVEPTNLNPTLYEPRETVSYKPEYDPFTTEKSKSGLNNTEMILIIVLMALVAMGAVAAILLFG